MTQWLKWIRWGLILSVLLILLIFILNSGVVDILTGKSEARLQQTLAKEAINVSPNSPAYDSVLIADLNGQLYPQGKGKTIYTDKGYFAFKLFNKLFFWKYKSRGINWVNVDSQTIIGCENPPEDPSGYTDHLAQTGFQVETLDPFDCSLRSSGKDFFPRKTDYPKLLPGTPMFFVACNISWGRSVVSRIMFIGCHL